jgi:hypothetical protein
MFLYLSGPGKGQQFHQFTFSYFCAGICLSPQGKEQIAPRSLLSSRTLDIIFVMSKIVGTSFLGHIASNQ